jgi:hypothetical protein
VPTRVPARAGAVPVRSTTLTAVAWRRGLASLRRLPFSRLARMVVLGALGGVFASLTETTSPLYALGLLAAVFLLGMEAIEPLSEEVDRPDLTDGLPLDRGALYLRHLIVPAITLTAVAMVGAATATVMDPPSAPAAFALAVPTALLGAIGPVVTTVLDAPLPLAVADTNVFGSPRGGESPFAMAEFAGFSTAFTAIAPVVLSGVAVVPVLVADIDGGIGTIARLLVGSALVIVAAAFWVRRRDRWAIGMRKFFEEGRQAGT